MSELFVDTSSLVKYYYPEPDSDKTEAAILKADRIYISRLSLVEMASALSKKVRARELTKQAEASVWNTFLEDLHATKMELVDLHDRHYARASEIIREFGTKEGIRTLDSLQLAAALGLPEALFLSADSVLSRVARKMEIKLARL